MSKNSKAEDEKNAKSKSSKKRFRVFKDSSSTSGTSDSNTENRQEDNGGGDRAGPSTESSKKPKDFPQIFPDTTVNIIFDDPDNPASSPEDQGTGTDATGSTPDEPLFPLSPPSVSTVSSQPPQVGCCCIYTEPILSIISTVAALTAGIVLLNYYSDKHIAMPMVAGFFIFIACVLFLWTLREYYVLNIRNQFLKEQKRLRRQLGSQTSTSALGEAIELATLERSPSGPSRVHSPETASGPSASRVHSPETASWPSASPAHSPETASAPASPIHAQETASAPASPIQAQETAFEPTSSRGKYPPKGDYRKGKEKGGLLQTDV